MDTLNRENLKELFEKFVGTEEAENAVEDFQVADRILNEYPAPEPDTQLIAAIKSEIEERIRIRQEHAFRRIAFKLAPVAAVFIVLAAVSVRLFDKNGGGPVKVSYASIIPAAIWESENIATDDADIVILTAELDELEVEVMTLESGEDTGNGRSAVTELEMEFVEINTDIWEG
jgi:hypothetical protein